MYIFFSLDFIFLGIVGMTDFDGFGSVVNQKFMGTHISLKLNKMLHGFCFVHGKIDILICHINLSTCLFSVRYYSSKNHIFLRIIGKKAFFFRENIPCH